MQRITHDEPMVDIDATLARDYLLALDRVLYSAGAFSRPGLAGFMTPLVLWPHHFDMGFIWFPGPWIRRAR